MDATVETMRNVELNDEKLDLFEDVFTEFEQMETAKIELKSVDLKDIVVPHSRARKEGMTGLKSAIKQFGVLDPPKVMISESNKYILLGGVRVLYACSRLGKDRINCLVYDFPDKNKAKKAILFIELMLNMHEPYTIREIWDTSRLLLSKMTAFEPDMIEYLLHMRPGDYTKLTEVMTCNEVEMLDYIDQLRNGQLSIDQAYKKLEKIRKGMTRGELLENQDSVELRGSEDDFISEALEGVGGGATSYNGKKLDDTEINDMLNVYSSEIAKLDDNELDDLNRTDEVRKAKKQDTRSREPIDPAIRKSRLIKDENSCQCCEDIYGEEHMYILDFHHVIPVSLGGPDSVENGITLCLNCHQLVHLYSTGDIPSIPESMDEKLTRKFKRIFILGNIIIDGLKRANMSKEEFKKAENPHFIGRKYPGTIKRELQKVVTLEVKA